MASTACRVSLATTIVRGLRGMVRVTTFILAMGVAVVPTLAAEAAPRRVILDTDGDGDYDALVGLMLAAVCPEIDLRGVVVTGPESEPRIRTVAKALDLMGRADVGVYRGEPPLSPRPPFDYFSQFPRRRYGMTPRLESWAADFVAPAPTQRGIDFVRQEVMERPGEVTVFVDGPLSTLASALRASDRDGSGVTFRRSLRQIYFSGGDFTTSEYNVYADVGAAREVFSSGVPIYQFGGEGEPKAYFTHEHREALWSAGTPATWALQDYYRLYRAGWDPTSPFVPILYDAHLPAAFVHGDAISEFKLLAVEVEDNGRLRAMPGEGNVHSRVVDHPDRLLAFIQQRLSDGVQPAANHLRALRRFCRDPECEAQVDTLLADVLHNRAPRGAELERRLDVARSLVPAGQAFLAARHAALARDFIQGQHRDQPWRDPYTSPLIAAYVLLLVLGHSKRLVAGGLALVLAVVIAARRRQSRRWRGPA